MADITLHKLASYAFGIGALLLGLVLALVSLAAGILLIAAGLLAMPVVRGQLSSRASLEFSTAAVAGLVVVLTIASLGTLVFAAAGDSASGPGSDVSNVTVAAQNTSATNTAQSLEVAWSARAQSAVDPDPSDMSTYPAEDGKKFLVVRMQLTNTGSESIEMTPRLFRALVDGVEYDYQALFGSGQGGLSGVTLRPDSTYDGWVAFSIPESATNAKLIVNQDAYYQGTTAVQFEHDPSLPVNVSA